MKKMMEDGKKTEVGRYETEMFSHFLPIGLLTLE